MEPTTATPSTYLDSFRPINGNSMYSASDLAMESITSRIRREQDDSEDLFSSPFTNNQEPIKYSDISAAHQRLMDNSRYMYADQDPWRVRRDPYTFGETSTRSIDRSEQRLIDDMRAMSRYYDKRLSEMQTTLKNQAAAMQQLAKIIDELQANQLEPLEDLD